jgi:MFS family permease
LAVDPKTTSAGARLRGVVSGLTVDITPLRRSRDFRLLFVGQIVNLLGSQLTIVALPYQVFLITHSSLMVGLLSFSQLVPLLAFSLLGGSIADIVDRRKLLAGCQVLLAGTSALLAVSAFIGQPPLWYLFTIAIVSACISAIAQPTYRAVIPQLVTRDQMTNAMAINQVINQTGRIAGASIAGLVLAAFGVGWAFIIDAVTYFAAIAALLTMTPMPPQDEGGFRDRFRAIGEGLSFLWSRPVLMSTFLVDINATLFGGPTALYPALALTVFKVGPQGLGLLYAAIGAGAFVGTMFSGWAKNVRHQGLATIGLICVWGIAIAVFGLMTRFFVLGLAMLAIAGASDTWSALFRSSMLQLAVPDRLRGRISAVHFMSVTGGPRLGALESGTMASLTNLQFSVVSGGLLSILGALIIGLAVPGYARYDVRRALAEAPAT